MCGNVNSWSKENSLGWHYRTGLTFSSVSIIALLRISTKAACFFVVFLQYTLNITYIYIQAFYWCNLWRHIYCGEDENFQKDPVQFPFGCGIVSRWKPSPDAPQTFCCSKQVLPQKCESQKNCSRHAGFPCHIPWRWSHNQEKPHGGYRSLSAVSISQAIFIIF